VANYSDFATVEIGGQTITAFESYEMTSDLLTPSDAFSLALSVPGSAEYRASILARIRANPTVTISIGRDVPGIAIRAPQMVGIIGSLAYEANKDHGATLRVSGTDKGGLLTTSSANPSLQVTSETEFTSFVRTLVAPYGIQVITESSIARNLATGGNSNSFQRVRSRVARGAGVTTSSVSRRALRDAGSTSAVGTSTPRSQAAARSGHANGMVGDDVRDLKISEAKPQVGETIWEFIDRHCKRFGILAWMDPQGRLILSAPDYEQAPLYHLRRNLSPGTAPNNILSGGFTEDIGSQPSSVTVYGRSRGHDETRTPFVAVVEQESFFHRPLVVHDNAVRSVEEARRRGLRELHQRAQEKFVLEYEVRDHGNDGYVYAVDSIFDVQDEAIGVAGSYYCTSRTFTKSRTEGTKTRLRLVPKGALAL
jgi:prophage tail gpP-like protein